MKNLVIIGAGGFGREVYSWAKHTLEYGQEWLIKGFLDDNPNALEKYNYDIKVISDIQTYLPKKNDVFICAIGDPKIKKEICNIMLNKGAGFTTIIHPSSVIGSNVTIGSGCIICPYVVITSDVMVGDFVTVNLFSSLGHDSIVGNWCTISCHCDITGFSKLAEGVFLGSHAVVLPSAKVGEYAKVGSGSVVLKKVKPYETVFGIPAKTI